MSRQPCDPHNWQAWAWELIERGELSGREGLVLLALAQYGNGDGTARPGTRTLAARVGVTDRPVREALEALRARGYIDGEPAPRRTTTWRFVIDDAERRRLRSLRTRTPQGPTPATADPGSAPVGAHLRSNCGATADPGSAEVEGEELPSLSSNVVALPERERERQSNDATDLARRLASRLTMDRTTA